MKGLFSPKSLGEKRLLFALIAITGISLLVLAIFYFLNPRSIVGDSLVNTASGNPLEVPPANTFPFYVKPVTIMFASAVIFSFSLFALVGERLTRLSRTLRAFLLILSILGLTVSSYEVLFNFALWASLLVSHSDPDTIVNAYPLSFFRINLVFATKSFVALLFISYFAFATFRSSLDSANT